MKNNSIDKKIDEQLQSAAVSFPINYDPSGWQKLSEMLDKANHVQVKKNRYSNLNLILLLVLSGLISVTLLIQNDSVSPIQEMEKKSQHSIITNSKISPDNPYKKQSEKLDFLMNSLGFSISKSEQKSTTVVQLPIDEVNPFEAPVDSTSKKESLFIFW